MRNIKVFLRTDKFDKENVLHAAGGTTAEPLLMNEIEEAARDQLSDVDFRVWRTSQRLLRYECLEADEDFESYGDEPTPTNSIQPTGDVY